MTSAVVDMYRNIFRSFVTFVFNEANPEQSLVEGWHLDVVTDALTQCAPGLGGRLIVNMPPRHLKSLCASITWPLFCLARAPGQRAVVIAGTRELAADFMMIIDRLVESTRFRAVFPQLRTVRRGDAYRFLNGSTLVVSFVGRSQIGRGANLVVIDDPLPPTHANDPSRREAINTWYGDEVAPRLNDKSASVIVVMQRLHTGDLTQHLRRTGNWRTLALSAIAVRDETWTLSDGWSLIRPKGMPLCAARADLAALRETLEQVEGRTFSAQYQQRPTHLPDGVNFRCYFDPPKVYDGWRPGLPLIGAGFKRVSLTQDVLRDVFGEGLVPTLPGARTMTLDEWEADAALQQRRLLEQCARA